MKIFKILKNNFLILTIKKNIILLINNKSLLKFLKLFHFLSLIFVLLNFLLKLF